MTDKVHPSVAVQSKIDTKIWHAEQKKKQLDKIIAELKLLELSPEQKEKVIKLLTKQE